MAASGSLHEAADLRMRPLDAKRGELRLISIRSKPVSQEKLTSDPVLECTVSIHSLYDVRVETHASVLGDRVLPKSEETRGQETQDIEEGDTDKARGNCMDDRGPSRYQWGDYVSMSYHWGNTSLSVPIIVNDKKVMISPNLAEGLLAISRLPGVANGEFKVWNDFICLNQHDKDEIERELKRIPTIFENSRMVVSYLGSPYNDSHLVMQLLNELSQQPQGTSSGMFIDSVGQETWTAVIDFVRRPYWRRLWIVQELALAHPSSILLCGTWVAPLSSLWKLVNTILENAPKFHHLFALSLGQSYTYHDNVRHDAFAAISHLHILHQIHKSVCLDHECNTLQLLNLCRRGMQLDPRDKVYGVLGLLPPRVTALINPSRDKTPHQVYTNLTKAIIVATRRLDILQNCRIGLKQIKYPTWVPDLEVNSGIHPFAVETSSGAGGDFSAEPYFLNDETILQVKGLMYDTISHLTPSQFPLLPISAEHLSQTRSSITTHVADRRTVRKTLCETLIGGDSRGLLAEDYERMLNIPWSRTLTSTEEAAQELIDHGWCTENARQDLITFLLFRQRAGIDFDIQGHSLGSLFPADMTVSHQPLCGVLRQMSSTMKRRRLIVTAKGKLGVAVREAQAGDTMAVLRGCSVPMILRQRHTANDGQTEFMVLGDCYVHGIMKGEALQDMFDAEQNIFLC